MSGNKGAHALWFDPRTKLILLILTIISAAAAPSFLYELGLVVIVAVFALLCGKWRRAFLGVFSYGVIYLLTMYGLRLTASSTQAMLLAFLGLVHKVYPCGFLAGIMISTTKVGEFLSAMSRVHLPKSIVIPLAVMLRYIPTIKEDWSYIKDAMRLRDVSPGILGFLSHPARTVECLYVPLMMAASKAADELSIASVTRGIENPKPRTCLVEIQFGFKDGLAVLCMAAYLMAGFLWREVFI